MMLNHRRKQEGDMVLIEGSLQRIESSPWCSEMGAMVPAFQ